MTIAYVATYETLHGSLSQTIVVEGRNASSAFKKAARLATSFLPEDWTLTGLVFEEYR